MNPVSRLLALLVRAYQLVLRPLLPPSCKFVPSCSDYAIEALRTHGLQRGMKLAAWRILRCNPFTAGGYDPVPAHAPEGPDNAACHGAGCSSPKRF